MSEVLVGVVQFAPGEDAAENLRQIEQWARKGAARGVGLVVFPEYSSFFLPSLGPGLVAHAEDTHGAFVRRLIEIAGEVGAVLVAGLLERVGDKVANTLVAVDGHRLLATYRKQHLYDAFGGRESDWLVAGDLDQPQTFDVQGIRVGMQTCYDIRFPEVTRRLVDAGAELVLVPAEWVRGPLKEAHWRTLLTARAIENTVYVAAADHTPPIGVGTSLIIDPMGVALAALGEQAELAVAPVSSDRVAAVRATNPSLALRRYAVVPRPAPHGPNQDPPAPDQNPPEPIQDVRPSLQDPGGVSGPSRGASS